MLQLQTIPDTLDFGRSVLEFTSGFLREYFIICHRYILRNLILSITPTNRPGHEDMCFASQQQIDDFAGTLPNCHEIPGLQKPGNGMDVEIIKVLLPAYEWIDQPGPYREGKDRKLIRLPCSIAKLRRHAVGDGYGVKRGDFSFDYVVTKWKGRKWFGDRPLEPS